MVFTPLEDWKVQLLIMGMLRRYMSSSWVDDWLLSREMIGRQDQHDVRGTAWYSLATRGLVIGGGVGGGVGRMFHCKSYSDS